uniref:Uncharacterized protein n=1 Tax=Sphaeramia orbicularis TaxID=375764 RepID=A0A673CP78_9TELE
AWSPSEMTFPSADRDRLILAASFSRFPFAPVLLWRSLPARSTMFSFPTRMWSSPSGPSSLHSTVMTKMAWDLELLMKDAERGEEQKSTSTSSSSSTSSSAHSLHSLPGNTPYSADNGD